VIVIQAGAPVTVQGHVEESLLTVTVPLAPAAGMEAALADSE
jgi:hypothetical protein